MYVSILFWQQLLRILYRLMGLIKFVFILFANFYTSFEGLLYLNGILLACVTYIIAYLVIAVVFLLRPLKGWFQVWGITVNMYVYVNL